MLLFLLACSTPNPVDNEQDVMHLGPGAEHTEESDTGSPDGDPRSDTQPETDDEGDDAVVAFGQLVSPVDGAVVPNPVTFRAEFSDLATLELYADEWRIGSLLPSGELTYAFEQVNRARVITLRGVDNEGRSIPPQTIEITPTEDVPSAGFTPVPYYFQYDNLYDPFGHLRPHLRRHDDRRGAVAHRCALPRLRSGSGSESGSPSRSLYEWRATPLSTDARWYTHHAEESARCAIRWWSTAGRTLDTSRS